MQEEMARAVMHARVVGDAEQRRAERVQGEHDHAVVDQDRGRVKAAQQLADRRPDGRPAPFDPARPGKRLQVRVLGRIKPQRPAHRIQHLGQLGRR